MKKLLFLGLFSAILFAKAQPNNNMQINNGQQTTIGLFNGANYFTFEFWVKTTENGSNNTYWQRPTLFGNATDGGNSGDFGVNINNGYIGMWEGISNANTDQVFLSNSVRINDNQWHHIAAVNDGKNINLFVDGYRITSLISGRRLNTSRAPLTFGASSLDFNFVGNNGNTNFPCRAFFGEARLSNSVRYGANFTPPQSFTPDGSNAQIYHLAGQGNNNNYDQQNQGYNQQNQNQYSQQNQPQYNNNQPQYNNQYNNQPPQSIDDRYAQMGKVYFNDNTVHEGRLTIDKQQYNPNHDIVIRFAEGNSNQFNYYRTEDIQGFQIGNDYYETKFVSAPAITNYNNKKTIVKLITSIDSKIPMYVYENHTKTTNSNNQVEFKTALVYLIGLPGSKDDKVYGFQSNLFSPKFDEKVSAIVQDNQALAAKIKSKDKDYFYAAFTGDDHRLKVWWNIINEYNSTH